MNREEKRLGKFIAFVLRHKPEAINIQLDKNGWTSVIKLLQQMNVHGKKINVQILDAIVMGDDKKRYAFSSDHTKIRASQGHSLDIDMQYKETEPPRWLYHGTSENKIERIKAKGILKMARTHVHLSNDIDTAMNVGKRHGSPVIIKVDAYTMHYLCHKFFLSENNIWLVHSVPTNYIKIMESYGQ